MVEHHELTPFERALCKELANMTVGYDTGVESVQLHFISAAMREAGEVHPDLRAAYEAAMKVHLPMLA